nr:colicin uptake protein TolR [Candidatus Profftia tarda]
MKSSNCRQLKNEINIVPLLDILLVLLLMFIATAPLMIQGIEVDLPDATTSKSVFNSNDTPIIIEVSRSGEYSVITGYNRMQQMREKQVVAEAQSQLRINPNKVFLIGGAHDVSYDEIIKALNMLRLAGVISVGLITKPT